MHVLFYCLTQKGVKGGIERLVAGLGNRLVDLGTQVSLVLDCYPEEPFPYELDPRVKVTRMKFNATNEFTHRLKNFLTDVQPDLIVVMRSGSWAFMTFSAAVGISGIPLILSEHAATDAAKKEFPNNHREFAFARADAIHLLMDEYKRELPQNFRQKVQVIPNFTNIVDFEAMIEKRQKATRRRRIIVVGRLTSGQKRPVKAYWAFQELANDFPEWDLVFCGEGPESDEIIRLATKNGLLGRVRLKGAIDDISHELAESDIFCLPSAYEGLSISLIEAMAHGLPSIVFEEAPGNNSLVKHGWNGFLAPGLHISNKLVPGLRKLMGSSEMRAELGRNAGNYALRFDPEKVINDWYEFLINTYENKKLHEPAGLGSCYTEVAKYYLDNDLF